MGVTEVKVNTDSKILKIKSFFSKQKEEKQPEKIWSKFSFGKTSKNESQGKSAEEARLEAEAEALNNLIRQQEEDNARKILLEENKNTQRARPGGILKHQLNAIKEEKYTNTIQQATDEEEGEDAQESEVKCLQRSKVEEKDGG